MIENKKPELCMNSGVFFFRLLNIKTPQKMRL